MDQNRAKFRQEYPQAFYLTEDDRPSLETFLRNAGWMQAGEAIVHTEKPGEGNMNYVLRVSTSLRSFIIKQARPWVEKYPQIPAPMERIVVESHFYQIVSEEEVLRQYIPSMIGFDSGSFILALEDLGQTADFTRIYRKNEQISPADLAAIVRFISHLHQAGRKGHPFPDNLPLRQLNAEHIFTYPYGEHDLDLDAVQPGLKELASRFKKDTELTARINELKAVYLSRGTTLLHGDYYPGSWLETSQGIRIIDPEFAFLGRPEFDLGVLVAHLKMAHVPDSLVKEGLKAYSYTNEFDYTLFGGFCGAEILRRVIGLAQLPLEMSLQEKADLLTWAREGVLNPDPYLLAG
jgi:5-methylthioribose kinase